MPDRPLRLALAQVRPQPGDVEANVQASAHTIALARKDGAALVAFPELSLTGYELAILASTPTAWLRPADPRLAPLQQACIDSCVTAIVGAPVRTDDGSPRIAAIVIDPTGAITISYKVHLHGSETSFFEPGAAAPPFTIAGWRVAVAICFDAARPRHAEAAAAAHADLYLVSALYAVGEERRVDLHLGARAMDHRMFAALANYAGTTGGHVSIGGSGLWGPSGAIVAREPSADDTLVVVDLDPAELARYR